MAVNKSSDPVVIELAKIEVEDSLYQFEVGEKLASFENQNLHAIRTQFLRVLEAERFENNTSLVQGKRQLRRPLKAKLDIVRSSSFNVLSLGDKRLAICCR